MTIAAPREKQSLIAPFLTAYDPSDLPGGSIDPLGFDRSYNFFADKILPGLTNVAHQPRYFGLLCAGALLGPEAAMPTRTEIGERQETVLRLERFWALANVLAGNAAELKTGGVRGITYAESHRDALARVGRRSTTADFSLLTRQVQYGVLGIYGNVAHGMRLIDRKTLGLTGDYGDELGNAFLTGTDTPKNLRAAVQDKDKEVGLDALREWGKQAHLLVKVTPGESRILDKALHLDRIRSRMADALDANPSKKDESELERLKRIAEKLTPTDGALVEAIEAILAFESCYAWALLAFERILWLCGVSGSLRMKELASDEVICRCAGSLPRIVARFERALSGAASAEFKMALDRLSNLREFLKGLATAGSDTGTFLEKIIGRHSDVQRGKFDQGRRKLPWVEIAGVDAILTMVRAAQVTSEPKRHTDIRAHEYRTAAADAFLYATRQGTR